MDASSCFGCRQGNLTLLAKNKLDYLGILFGSGSPRAFSSLLPGSCFCFFFGPEEIINWLLPSDSVLFILKLLKLIPDLRNRHATPTDHESGFYWDLGRRVRL